MKRALPDAAPEDGLANISGATTQSRASIKDSQIATGSNISQQTAVHHHYASPQSQVLRPTTLLPHHIYAYLKSLSPFDQHHAREKYIGLDIGWLVSLQSINHRAHSYYVLFYAGSDDLISADFRDLPPGLKISQRGARFWIYGRIERVTHSAIELATDPTVVEIDEQLNKTE